MTTEEATTHESQADDRPQLTDEQYRKVMRKGWNLTPDPYEAHWVPRIRYLAVEAIGRAAPPNVSSPAASTTASRSSTSERKA